MCYIGSFYIPEIPTRSLEKEVERPITLLNLRKDGFMIQVLLLFAIGLDESNEQKKADDTSASQHISPCDPTTTHPCCILLYPTTWWCGGSPRLAPRASRGTLAGLFRRGVHSA